MTWRLEAEIGFLIHPLGEKTLIPFVNPTNHLIMMQEVKGVLSSTMVHLVGVFLMICFSFWFRDSITRLQGASIINTAQGVFYFFENGNPKSI